MRRPGWLFAGNATGFAVSTRFAGPPLRCGPSGDTANPAAKRSMTTGRVLPVVIDRLFDYDAPDVPAMSLTSCRSGGKLRSSRIPNQSEHTLIRPSDCPTNQDHLTLRVHAVLVGLQIRRSRL